MDLVIYRRREKAAERSSGRRSAADRRKVRHMAVDFFFYLDVYNKEYGTKSAEEGGKLNLSSPLSLFTVGET